MMSTVHLFSLRTVQDQAAPRSGCLPHPGLRPAGQRAWFYADAPVYQSACVASCDAHEGKRDLLQRDVLKTNGYGSVVLALFCFHFALFLPGPLFALRWVDQLGFSDQTISLGTAVFHMAVLVGALQLSRLTKRYGNYRLTVVGALLLSTYPLLTALMNGAPMYIVASILGGLSWAIVGGALANYLLERIPPENRAPYLTWYNLSLNAAIVAASLLGPLLAYAIGIVPALLVAFLLRIIGGLAIYRSG